MKDYHNDIDTQVWKPFQEAFQNLDAEALNAIYAENVIRVTPDGIDTQGSFKLKNVERFKIYKAEGKTIALDFWFDDRKTNATTSYEVGFYCLAFTSSNGSADFIYGQFHIVLKNTNGNWKIAQDWDTGTLNGSTITKEDFERKTPLTFK